MIKGIIVASVVIGFFGFVTFGLICSFIVGSDSDGDDFED